MESKLIICVNRRIDPRRPSCAARGAEALATQLEQSITELQLPITVERVYCLGECDNGPNMRLAPGGPLFQGVDEKMLESVLKAVACFATRAE